ncbi:MAG: 7-carboxy-7-deazaguanine synthase QueE [Sandaracinus sp.]|nr:7-carboxy-7-deazaguanine synthase QueE [Sandaracinus sp.]MCB9618016.1 7-carboxy-7-deazaguanine synthase QueE [Sandaracinus sp.]MCB9622249.1 7-carboxy-7-deazaguanine synthase QueE [Sandaracinus sp.]
MSKRSSDRRARRAGLTSFRSYLVSTVDASARQARGPTHARQVKLRIVPDRLVVSEVFDSVQGEGPSTGVPSTFLRLGLCNLACVWCDTAYTWDARRFDLQDELRSRSLEEVAEDLAQRALKNLVLTGGEPLLQADALDALVPTLTQRIEVETAGTLAPSPTLLAHVAQWNVSPKLASSGNAVSKRRRDDVLSTFASIDHAYFKLVIADDTDLEEARELLDVHGVPRERTWLMPEGTTPERIAERGRWLADVCTREGFRLGTRLHVVLWGDRRGV